jgi:hypothetical protein
MSQLHVIVCIETNTGTLPDGAVTASTWAGNVSFTTFKKGSYDSDEAQHPSNSLVHKVCANVESLLHTPPYVAIKMITFDAAEADECIKHFRGQNKEDRVAHLLDSDSVWFTDADEQNSTWYVRVRLDALEVANGMTSAIIESKQFPDFSF